MPTTQFLNRIWNELPRHRLRAFLVIASISFLIRAAILLAWFTPWLGHQGEAERVAVAVATEGRFADPYVIPTGPTAHNPPALPIMLAPIYIIFGTGYWGGVAKTLAIVASHSIAYGLQPAIAAALGLPMQIGVLSGLICALLPLKRTAELHLSWDEAVIGLVLAGMLIVTRRIWRVGKLNAAAAFGYGALWGLAFHFSPSLLTVFLGLLAASWFMFRPRSAISRVAWGAACLAAVFATILPWTIRNHRQLGGWMFMRSNAGLELWLANHPLTTPSSVGSEPVFGNLHPGVNAIVAEEVRELGEVRFNRLRAAEAVSWIGENPRRLAWLTAQRIYCFWFGIPELWKTSLPVAAFTIVGFWGLFQMFRTGHTITALLLLVTWIAYPVTYYLVIFQIRYRVPIDWSIMLASGFGLACLASRRLQTQTSGPQAVAASNASES